MLSIDRVTLRTCLRKIGRGLIRFCLKHSIKVQEIEECLRDLYLEEAKEEIRRRNEKISHSRLSVITGLSRREVQRIEEAPEVTQNAAGLIMRVIGMWQSNSRFLDRSKNPKVLSFGFEESEFAKLVAMVSKDLNSATVLFELERVSAVARTEKGLSLLVKSYRPKGDVQAGFKILEDDITDLINIVGENVLFNPNVGNLHLRTEYDRIRPEGITEIKAWLLREGNALHARAREKIATYDQDVNPDPQFNGNFSRVVLGTFGAVDGEEK